MLSSFVLQMNYPVIPSERRDNFCQTVNFKEI